MNFYVSFNISNQNPTSPPYFFLFLFILSFCLYLLSQFLMTHAILITLPVLKTVRNLSRIDAMRCNKRTFGIYLSNLCDIKEIRKKEKTCLMYGKDHARRSRECYIKTIYSFWTWSAQISMFNQTFSTYKIVPVVTFLKIERQDFSWKSSAVIDIIINFEKFISLVLY